VGEAKKNLSLNMAESKTRHEFIRAYNELADLLGNDDLMEAEIEYVKTARRDAQRSAKVNKRFESLPLEKREAILAEHLSPTPPPIEHPAARQDHSASAARHDHD
jgi:hypothetical protein